ncbi:MAG: hypothetical protein CMB99_11645 [Flavobacteriaceae bacterium]|nr:hypothetical protein [Flavobacteriaceae bacterium]|tara:strand:- start:228969 stop:229517 length:549 start_codon:yes stop_codon:yes gene_type:complete
MEYIEKVSYQVDKSNTIVEVSDDWIKAATVGQADDLTVKEKVIGRSILSYIVGEATKMYYQVVFGKCRRLGKEHTINYRCDSPSHKRFMQMVIKPDTNESLNINNYLLREEPFNNPVHIEETTGNFRNPTQRCSICNKLKLSKTDDWKAPEELSKEESKEYIVIHTICPSCHGKDWRSNQKN